MNLKVSTEKVSEYCVEMEPLASNRISKSLTFEMTKFNPDNFVQENFLQCLSAKKSEIRN